MNIKTKTAVGRENHIGSPPVWEVGTRMISFSGGAKVMAIVNATPDSFYDGGKHAAVDAGLRFVGDALENGAEFVDIGGESTRPGGARLDTETELNRVIPLIEAVVKRFDIPVSIDTSKSVVARAAMDSGAAIINDISGLTFDQEMAKAAASANAAVVLMHLVGEFNTMHRTRVDGNIVETVINGLNERVELALAAGIRKSRICLDVGIGFSKTLEQNLELIRSLPKIVIQFEPSPILIGVSRKSFIGKVTGHDDPSERLAGTVTANAAAILNGASIIRVHDVRAAVDSIKMLDAIGGKYE